MVDDDEQGRPPRHERTASRSMGGWMGDVLRRGSGPTKRVRGKRKCGACGEVLTVDFSGPADSLGVRVSEGRLAAPRCEACEETETAAGAAAERAAELVERTRRRVASAGLPQAWRTLTFEDLEVSRAQAPAVQAGREWAEGRLPGLLLHGDVGRGKTVIAAAAAAARCVRSPVRWLSVAELLMDLRMPFEAPEYARAVRRLDASRAALVLDDLDKMRASEHQLQPLYVAINGWLEAGLPLLVTMNRDLDSLAEWAGETFGRALASRMAGYCEVIEVTGPDWRVE